ncbi:MAG: NCS2 family permease, partial [Verrucomicrobiae bacterium]|nr:NCS2 family permease [Verrucomicrobiae bacterium]
TAMAAALGTLAMAFLGRLPIALAPGMGMNAFFSYEICGHLGVPWQGALGIVFWNGILFLAISLTPLRLAVVRAIPESLKTGMQVGIGLLIAFIGLQKCGLIGDHPATLVTLNDLSDGWTPNTATLAMIGIILTSVLLFRKVAGGVLIGIFAVAVLGLWVPGEGGEAVTRWPDRWMAAPASIEPLLFKADLLYPFRHWQVAWVPVVMLMFVDLFDSIGTLIGVSRRAGLVDEKGELPGMGPALVADAAATSVGALLGTSPVTAYVESAAGVEAGGRTWRTGVVVASCFLLALFFHPVILRLPAAATAPALVVVGVLMLSGLKGFDWSDLRETAPAALTMMLIPFGFGIADGIAIGCVVHVAVFGLTGAWRRVHPLLAVLAGLFVLKFVLVGA